MSDTNDSVVTGQEVLARPRREPTVWTHPLRWAVGGFMVVASAQWLVTAALFVTTSALERSQRAQNPGVSSDDLARAAQLGVALGWAATVAGVVVMLVLALGSLKGWRWAFWVALVWLALSSIGILTRLVALVNPASQPEPVASNVIGLVLAAAALALALCCATAGALLGPWAMRRVT